METPKSALDLNSMHDKCKQVILFHNNLCKFFKALKGVLPECANILKPAITYYKSATRSDYTLSLKTLMEPHMKYVSQYDEGIFTDDYQVGKLELIPMIDFRDLWKLFDSEDFKNDEALLKSTKRSIFNHLQTIYISACMSVDQIGSFNKNMEKQKALLLNMIENLKFGDKIKEKVAEMKNKEDADAAKSSKGGLGIGGLGSLLGGLGGLGGLGDIGDLGDIGSLFGEDNFIYQLAKDIVAELDMGNNDIDNPLESIMSLFANGGQKIQDLIIKIGDKLEQKIAKGEIDKDQLLADAQKMKDKLATVAPGLTDLMGDNDLMSAHLKERYESLSPENKLNFADIPAILEKSLAERTPEENARCMEMVGKLNENTSD